MRIPLAKYGLPEVAVYPAFIILLMAGAGLFASARLPAWTLAVAESVLTLVLIWTLMFFRGPNPPPLRDDAILLAPADGQVRDIETVDEADFIGGRALRIGIFLSIFNTHINRAPCSARVERITYRRGEGLHPHKPPR